MTDAKFDLQQSHDLVRAYFAAVTAGHLPDSLLTEDMTAWLTTEGEITKEAYQHAVHLLARMCAEPIQFTIDAITAEGDRAVAEARSSTNLISGVPYAMTYVFTFRIRDGRIARIAEHYNSDVMREKLLPLMIKLSAEDAS